MSGCVFIAAAGTWILPAGAYERVANEATGRDAVVPGSYAPVDADPATPFDALVAIPRGITEVGDIIALIFLIGGALTVVDRTGALGRGVSLLVRGAGDRGILLLPLVALVFVGGGILFNMAEEIVALVPVLLVLMRKLGYRPIVAVMVSGASAALGASFSHMNPFQVLIAQRAADVSPGSGAGFRIAFLAAAVMAWLTWVTWFAHRTRMEPEIVKDEASGLTGSDAAVLTLTALTFAWLGWGIQAGGWDFTQMAAPFFALAILGGWAGGLGNAGTANAFVEGARDMTFAGVLIGLARAIVLVLQDARVVDTIVHGLFQPLEGLPVLASAAAMVVAQAAVHVPVASVSGQAVLTMPILSPLADLLGLSRQVAVLAFQYGAGLTDMITPTNGALMAVLTAAGVRYEEWFSATIRMWLFLLALAMGAVVLAQLSGLG
jgi:uncharacterized ion transporter superfamily protein YfcC